MSPTRDLTPVADSGREAGRTFRHALEFPESARGAFGILTASLARNLGYGGRFDYQRSGNILTGYRHLRQFADVSNFNVGLLCQQAGLSLKETLTIAGNFAKLESSNSDPSDAYGLDHAQRHFMELGFAAGQEAGFPAPGLSR